jgi:hypothetical protein
MCRVTLEATSITKTSVHVKIAKEVSILGMPKVEYNFQIQQDGWKYDKKPYVPFIIFIKIYFQKLRSKFIY